MPCEVPISNATQLQDPPGWTPARRHVEFSSFDLDTHPIDMVTGVQGWGPFYGMWTPLDFESAKDSQTGGSGLDITWFSGDNQAVVDWAPPYAVLTIMQDRSLDFVNNNGTLAIIAAAQQPRGSSTFSQSQNVQSTGVTPAGQTAGSTGFLAAVTKFLGGSK